MTRDEQARQRLVRSALGQALWVDNEHAPHVCLHDCTCMRAMFRRRAGFRDASKGHWCAAGLTAAMEDAGLLVPSPGTPARRGAIALLDWIGDAQGSPSGTSTNWVAMPSVCRRVLTGDVALPKVAPGDIIAWLQHLPPDPAGWRRGHVAVIVAVDEESITTVGWNEGKAPGRVMMRRLWRDPNRPCAMCAGSGRHHVKTSYGQHVAWTKCRKTEPRSSTVLYRRPGGLYGIARPVAR